MERDKIEGVNGQKGVGEGGGGDEEREENEEQKVIVRKIKGQTESRKTERLRKVLKF